MNLKGAQYEEQAVVFLKRSGFEVADRNWSCPMGELDIVARKGSTLVFVEVRARSNPGYGTPADSVTPAKRAKLVKTAMAYLKAKKPEAEEYRFDVIAIVPGREPEHIEEAFNADGFGFF